MTLEKYQKARQIQTMLAGEATYNNGLNMQLVLAELPDDELQLLERLAQRCRVARQATLYRSGSRIVHENKD